MNILIKSVTIVDTESKYHLKKRDVVPVSLDMFVKEVILSVRSILPDSLSPTLNV